MRPREKKKVQGDYDRAVCINLNPLVATTTTKSDSNKKRNLFEESTGGYRMEEKAKESELAKTDSRKSPEGLVARVHRGNAAAVNYL